MQRVHKISRGAAGECANFTSARHTRTLCTSSMQYFSTTVCNWKKQSTSKTRIENWTFLNPRTPDNCDFDCFGACICITGQAVAFFSRFSLLSQIVVFFNGRGSDSERPPLANTIIINDCPIAVGVENPHKFWMCRSLATLDKL
jgi:hypothetical protein